MAKFLCLVAVLLVASAIVVEADHLPKTAPAPAPSTSKVPATFLLKVIINNLASREVKFQLVIRGRLAAKAVVAKANTWTGIEPVKVGLKVPVVALYVTLKNNRGKVVRKSFPVKLRSVLKDIRADSSKYFSLTVTEVKARNGVKKLLVVKVGRIEYFVARL